MFGNPRATGTVKLRRTSAKLASRPSGSEPPSGTSSAPSRAAISKWNVPIWFG
jgi:hypothetical protein